VKEKLKIFGAGNVVVPAFLTLRQRGYSVRRMVREDGTARWIAENEEREFQSDDPVTLLALAAIGETRGEKWRASDQEIESFLAEYGGG
jgi:hypothetical protein